MSTAYTQTNLVDPNQHPNQFSSQSQQSQQSLTNSLPRNNGNSNNNSNGRKTIKNLETSSNLAQEPQLIIEESSNGQELEPVIEQKTKLDNTSFIANNQASNNQTGNNQASVASTNRNSNSITINSASNNANNANNTNRVLLSRESRGIRERARNPTLSLPVDLLNKRQHRIFLELIKGCFSSRLPDEAIIDSILRVSVVDDEILAGSLCSDFAEALYVPNDNEDIDTILAKLANIKRPSNDEDSLNSTPTVISTINNPNNRINNNPNNPNNFNNFNNNRTNGDSVPKNDTYRIPISPLTYRVLTNLQRSLSSYLFHRPDINALATKLIDTGNYSAKDVVIEIQSHFKSLQQQRDNYSKPLK